MRRASAISLVVSNLVVAFVAVSQQWGYYSVVLIFWLEAMTIGFFALGRLALVCWFGEPLGRWIGLANGFSRFALSLVAGGFFIVKFGGFALAMGVLVTMLPGFFVADSGSGFREVTDAVGAVGPGVATAAALLFASHGLSFLINFVGKREYKQRNIVVVLFEPYLRMGLVVAVLAAGFLATVPFPALYRTTAFAFGVILLKTVADLISHAYDHRERASSPAKSPAARGESVLAN